MDRGSITQQGGEGSALAYLMCGYCHANRASQLPEEVWCHSGGTTLNIASC